MAEISSCSVFTNDSDATSSDLLQQAFQQVVDDEDRENEYVTFLHCDDANSQTIQLTPEQAAAFGLTFEVSSTEEVMYRQHVENGISEDIIMENNVESHKEDSSPTRESLAIAQINFENDQVGNGSTSDSLIKNEYSIDFQEWHLQESSRGEKFQKQILETDLSLSEVTVCNENQSPQQKIIEQQNTTAVLMEPKVCTVKADGQRKKMKRNHYSIQEPLAQTDGSDSITGSQAQILQKLPLILPLSPQFIIKPAQTILKPTKNIKLLQSSNKMINTAITPVNTVNASSIDGNTNSNSMLFSKATILNPSSQIIKATPITTQFINTNGVSTQFLNTSQILSGSCEIPSHAVNASQISNNVVSTMPTSTQNLVTCNKICLSPIVKMAQPSFQKGNLQQYFTPLKNSITTMSKDAQGINNNNVTSVSNQLSKVIQLPGQITKASSISIGKKTAITTPVSKTIVNPNSSVIFRTAPIIKTSDLKTTTNNSTSILKPTQILSSPVSILKPHIKIAVSNANKQNITTASQNIVTCTNALSNVSQKVSVKQHNETFDLIKLTQDDTAKQNLNPIINNAYLKASKKAKNATVMQPASRSVTESADLSKISLSSTEDPVHIVQQAQSFHSIQRLSQNQLKQIAQVLQQRSQEAAISNERVVYRSVDDLRVVFPEELDLRIRNPVNLLKNRGGKRGRPKKTAARPSVFPPKPPPVVDDEQEEIRDERKKLVARTRSGRLSRPPRHMVRDYKHLHHLDFLQPDLDDSDGGYSDYNTNHDKIDEEEAPKELLAGLEVPKRKISDHFRCPTCSKIYLGRSRMARHFEMHPDHGSPEQLPPPTVEPELKQNNTQDLLKRKGKKRGPWAYVTPEAKSERRQIKLKEAISVCENSEIIKVAAKPVLNAQTLFDLLVLKADHNVRNFLNELKHLMDKIREKSSTMLTIVNGNEEQSSKDVIDINEELLCDALGINPGLYIINTEALLQIKSSASSTYDDIAEPPLKLPKLANVEDTKENSEERMSSGFSESSDLSVSDFLNDRRNDSTVNPTCPEVLSALTLMRRNPSPTNNVENKSNNVSKLLISNPEIQNQISDNPGFQKVDINTSKTSNFDKTNSHKEGFIKLSDSVGLSNCSQVFCKVETNYDHSKQDHIEQTFIKLEPVEQGFVKLENGTALGSFQKQDAGNLEKMRNNLDNMETGSQSFAKGFQRLVSKIIPSSTSELNCVKAQMSTLDTESCKLMPTTSDCKIAESISILQESVPIMSNNCENNIFEGNENLDMSKITQYDHIAHLDILNTSGVIDKNLLIDEKLVEQLVDQTNLVDELVSERLKNIIPDNILESNLIPNNTNLDADLDFEELSEEFNRNTTS